MIAANLIRFAVVLLPLALFCFELESIWDVSPHQAACIFLIGFWLGGVVERLERKP